MAQCDGSNMRPRMMWRNDEARGDPDTDPPDVFYGMCCGCFGRGLMYEVIPPSQPEWRREFRLAPHEPIPESSLCERPGSGPVT